MSRAAEERILSRNMRVLREFLCIRLSELLVSILFHPSKLVSLARVRHFTSSMLSLVGYGVHC